MKISPNTKLSIIFWSITAPVAPFIVLMILIGIILAVIPPFRNPSLNTVENLVRKFAIWRNNLPVVKNAYDKAHLFDYLKDSKG